MQHGQGIRVRAHIVYAPIHLSLKLLHVRVPLEKYKVITTMQLVLQLYIQQHVHIKFAMPQIQVVTLLQRYMYTNQWFQRPSLQCPDECLTQPSGRLKKCFSNPT